MAKFDNFAFFWCTLGMELVIFGFLFVFVVFAVKFFQLKSRVEKLEREVTLLQSLRFSPKLETRSLKEENSELEIATEDARSQEGVAAEIGESISEGVSAKAIATTPPKLPVQESRIIGDSWQDESSDLSTEFVKEKGPGVVEIWLEKMGLKPPRSDEEGANPMAWWSTRVGLGFGVIAAVFLGLYVNQDTVPWVRLMELVLVAVAVFGVGCWFERKLQGFGRALSAGGLSLLFVAAYAAYGLPAMKVIESPIGGAFTQIGALVLTVAWALLKRREAIFGLALVLGYVTCAFSAAEGLEPIPLVALLVLCVAGTSLFVLRGWWSGLWGAVLGSVLGLTVLAVLTWSFYKGPSQLWGTSVGLVLTVLPLIAVSWRWRRGEKRAKLMVPVITSLGLLSNAVVYGVRGWDFEIYYAVFAILFLVAGWWWRRDEGEGFWQTLWAKAMVMVALFMIARFDGPVRAFSLLVQAGGLIWLSRTRSRMVFEIGAGLGVLVGWSFLRADAVDFWSWESRGRALAYLISAQGLLIWYRFLGREKGQDNLVRRGIVVIFAIGIAGYVVMAGCGNEERLWLILVPLGFAVLSLVQFWPLKLKDGEWTPFVVLVGTLLVLVMRAEGDFSMRGPVGIWLVGGGAFYAWLGRSESRQHLSMTLVILLGVLVAVKLLGEDVLGRKWLAVSYTALAFGVHVLGSRFRYFTLRGFAILAAVVGLGWLFANPWKDEVLVVYGVGLLFATFWWFWGWWNSERNKMYQVLMEGVGTTVWGVWLWFILDDLLRGLPLVLALGGSSAVLMIGWRFLRAESLSWLGFVFSFLGALFLFEQNRQAGFSWVVAFYFLLFVGQGIWLSHGKGHSFLARPKVASVMWGGAAMLVILLGLVIAPEVASWTTASWAVAAVFLLASGFWFGLRGYRMVALGGLFATIVRMFMVDIQDSFWRILAFGITGALLVGIGYLYNRYSKRLADGDLDWGKAQEGESALESDQG